MTESPALFTMYTTSWCGDCFRIKHFLQQQKFIQGKDYTEVNIENDPAAMEIVERINDGHQSVPTLIFRDGEILTEPSISELHELLTHYTT